MHSNTECEELSCPEEVTPQRDTPIPTDNLPNDSDSGQDKSLTNGTQALQHNSGSELLPAQKEVRSAPLEPSRHPTKETANSEMVGPSTDNSSQVHTQDIPCTCM